MTKPDRFAHVDSLRAIGALLVVWLHITEHFSELPGRLNLGPQPTLLIAETVDFGRIGVLIFFLISGFLIPSSLKGGPVPGARHFVIRRFFRLYPLYWLSIPLALATVWWPFGKSPEASVVAMNLTMIQGLFKAPDILGLYWTLRVELYFYAICLLLFLAGALRKDWVIALIAVGLLPVSAVSQLLYQPKIQFFDLWASDLSYLVFMFTGTLWRRLCDGGLSLLGRCGLALVSAFFVLGFPLIALHKFLKEGALHPDHIKLFFGYSLAMVIFVAGVTFLRIRWRPLAWMGVISYSIYLMHPIVFYPIYWCIDKTPALSPLRQLPLAAYLAAITPLVVLVSALTYRFVEKPMISLGARLTAEVRKPALVPQDAS